MPLNILSEPIFSTNKKEKLSLPELISGLVTGSVNTFTRIPAHQATLFHSFICQLMAMAISRHASGTIPETSHDWHDLLLEMSGGDAVYWELVTPLDQPAFMQPAIRDKSLEDMAAKGNRFVGTDGIDLIFSAKNHTMKIGRGAKASYEEWIYTLIAAQTGSGYGGISHYGSVRLASGTSSRPFMGLVPVSGHDISINVSKWVMRDVKGILKHRKGSEADHKGKSALLWLMDWDGEANAVDIADLDPLFIETCKRIKLQSESDRTVAYLTGSKGCRIATPEKMRGVCGDPWAPVRIFMNGEGEDARAERVIINMGAREIDYKMVLDLVLGDGSFERPYLMADQTDDEVALLIDYMGRTKGKTMGHKSRVVLLPKLILNAFDQPGPSEMVAAMLQIIDRLEKIAFSALRLYFCNGDFDERQEMAGKQISKAEVEARERMQRATTRKIDRRFFAHLGRIVTALDNGAEQAALANFREWVSEIVTAEVENTMKRYPRRINVRLKADALASSELYWRMRQAQEGVAA